MSEPSQDTNPLDDKDYAEIVKLRQQVEEMQKLKNARIRKEQLAQEKRRLLAFLEESGSENPDPASDRIDPLPQVPIIDPVQQELLLLRNTVKQLQSDKSLLERKIMSNATHGNNSGTIALLSRLRAWNGEFDYSHEGLKDFAKAAHKRYKDINLPPHIQS